MIQALSTLSACFLPGAFAIILAYGILHRAPVYDLFIDGAKEGLRAAGEILPFLLAIFLGIEGLVSSGAMDFLYRLTGPLFSAAGIPEDLIPLILLRPVSGSGSLVLVQEIVENAGADSFAGRAAAVMAGSCETVFYVLAVYFGVTGVKRIRHSLAAGLIGYVTGVAASLWICRIL